MLLHEDDRQVCNCVIYTFTSIHRLHMAFSSFPLCCFLKNLNRCHLSYEAKEISCHNQEVYVERLSEHNYNYLMVHSYRAAIEKIICKYWPDLKHSGLKSIKHTSGLKFADYCLRATSHLDVVIPMSDIFSEDVQNDLKCWKKVVIFYTLRLILASLVETIILYDRMLCVADEGKSNKYITVEDCSYFFFN